MEREIKRNRQGRILSYEIINSNDTYGVIDLDKNIKLFTPKSFYSNQNTQIQDLEISEPSIIGYSFDRLLVNEGVDEPPPQTGAGSSGDGSSDNSAGAILFPFGVIGQYQGESRRDPQGLEWIWDIGLNRWIRQGT